MPLIWKTQTVKTINLLPVLSPNGFSKDKIIITLLFEWFISSFTLY